MQFSLEEIFSTKCCQSICITRCNLTKQMREKEHEIEEGEEFSGPDITQIQYAEMIAKLRWE